MRQIYMLLTEGLRQNRHCKLNLHFNLFKDGNAIVKYLFCFHFEKIYLRERWNTASLSGLFNKDPPINSNELQS